MIRTTPPDVERDMDTAPLKEHAMTKRFPLRVVLTVTTGRLLTKPKDGGNGIGDLYEFLNHMTGDDLMTHQLPRASEQCKPWLFRWFPELERVNETDFAILKQFISELGPEAGCTRFVEAVQVLHGLASEYDVPQFPVSERMSRPDAMQELSEMCGGADGIIAVVSQ